MRTISVQKTSHWGTKGYLADPAVTSEAFSLYQVLDACHRIGWAMRVPGVIPPRHVVNALFEAGELRDYLRWEPFSIEESEYDDLCAEIEALTDGYCIADPTLWGEPDYAAWIAAVGRKIRAHPTWKPLTWTAQNDLVGIPIGESAWIVLDEIPGGARFAPVDTILRPLWDMFDTLKHCEPECCGLAAFDFGPEALEEVLAPLDSHELVPRVREAILALELQEPNHAWVRSDWLNARLARTELIELLRHLESVASRVD